MVTVTKMNTSKKTLVAFVFPSRGDRISSRNGCRSIATQFKKPTVPQIVRIEFKHPTANKICIAGTFNDWRPGASEMIWLGDDRWGKELSLLPGYYEYLFWVDGQWMQDPRARASISNSYGGKNSVLVVPVPGSQWRWLLRLI